MRRHVPFFTTNAKAAVFATATLVLPAASFADGCYICASGSSPECKDYCRYTGPDTFDARKSCEKRGCKIAGTSSCPTAANYKVCAASFQGDRVIAQVKIPWCAPRPS